eukprot:COSAG02_NODE_35934_length_461_cov_0.837017_1_plen_60_part_01
MIGSAPNRIHPLIRCVLYAAFQTLGQTLTFLARRRPTALFLLPTRTERTDFRKLRQGPIR